MTESLRIKTYFATSVEAALGLARRELGPDAMLLNSRQSPAEARHLGQYEVVFAIVPEEAEPSPKPFLHPVPVPQSCTVASLERAGVETELARGILGADAPSIPAYMETLVSADPMLSGAHQGAEVAALVGPPGRGKTTTLVKLAIRFGLAKHKPVRFYSADYLRVAAPAQLRTLAGILGVTFESFDSPATLEHALRNPLPGITLVDTPGFSPRDHDAAQALARCLAALPGVESHLVLRADASASALNTAIDRFSAFRPARLLFTGLDEITQAGAAFSAAARARIPVSFLTNGQSIPEDLEPASTARLVELALGPFYRAALAAA